MNNNNKSAGVLSAEESWASSLSSYLLLRRQQTYLAYTNKSIAEMDCGRDTEYKASLFSAFVILLAGQLEEGHTVLTLSESDQSELLRIPVSSKRDETSRRATTDQIQLYDWQLRLIKLLASPLMDFVNDDKNETYDLSPYDSFVDSLSVILEKREQLLWQVSFKEVNDNQSNKNDIQTNDIQTNDIQTNDSPITDSEVNSTPINHQNLNQIKPNHKNPNFNQLNKSDKQQLKQRIDLIVNIVNFFHQNPQSKPLNIESLVNELEKHKLFKCVNEIENSLSNKNTPILYTLQRETKNSRKFNTLTIWLHRAWQAEYNLALKVKQILNHKVTPLDIDIPENLNAQQINAIQTANNNAFSIITGGPGTGKTYTVAQLVMSLQQVRNDDEKSTTIKFRSDSASLALAAPTGKAAQRMQESLQSVIDSANSDLKLKDAKTIHRLLGIGRTGKPRYNADNPLGEDIIIVDEASMLGVELANYLVSAIKPGARLILLGDANQLAAVDAGAVLADLCRIPLLNPIHVELTESRRFKKDSGIGQLAYLINHSNSNHKQIWQLLNQDKSLSFVNINEGDGAVNDAKLTNSDIDNNQTKNSLSIKNQKSSTQSHIYNLQNYFQNYLVKIKELLDNPILTDDSKDLAATITELMDCFNQFRILTAGHHGEWGDHNINQLLTGWHTTQLKLPIRQDAWYHGRPIMVLQNNYELGLFNGDIGICLLTNDINSNLKVFFENKAQGIAVNQLSEALITTAYAMTIHKSQGSEFEHVAISLDKSHSRLLSKELIYTAVTRAKNEVTIFSSPNSFETAIETATQRNTGLELQF